MKQEAKENYDVGSTFLLSGAGRADKMIFVLPVCFVSSQPDHDSRGDAAGGSCSEREGSFAKKNDKTFGRMCEDTKQSDCGLI